MENESRIRAGYISRDRAIYNHILDLPITQGKSKPTKSYLRQERDLTDGTVEYEFNFKEETGGTPLPERLLKNTDVFFAHRIGLFLKKEVVAKKYSSILNTFPNPVEFPDGGTFTAKNLYCIYEGLVYSKTDKSIVFDGIEALDFLKVPNKQAGEVVGVKDTERISKEDFLDIEPIFTLDGRNSNSLFLKLPPIGNLPIQSPDVLYKHKIVMILQGYFGLGYAKQ